MNAQPEPSPEISDLIVSYDAETLIRQPVRKREVIDRFLSVGNRRAAHLVERVPDRDGALDPEAVDTLLVRAHTELQRLSEEFEHGRRVAELLRPLLSVCRKEGVSTPIRVVDVGCGLGYVSRWLAAFGELGPDIELIGADYNAALVAEARRLAEQEHLRVAFVTANAFRFTVGVSVYLTTGVLHHFRGAALTEFFRAHERSETAAFVHFDFQPSRLAPVGAWVFHAARFREPLARHDGVLSAIRAHDASTLLNAARRGAPGFQVAMYSTRLWRLPMRRPFHTLVGIRPPYREALVRALGPRAARLEQWY